MKLTKGYKKVIKTLYKQDDKSVYVNIENLFGANEKAHEYNTEYQKIIQELEAENLIERKGGDHLHPMRTTSRKMTGYIYSPLKARITLLGITQWEGQNSPDLHKILTVLIPLGIFTIAYLGYQSNNINHNPGFSEEEASTIEASEDSLRTTIDNHLHDSSANTNLQKQLIFPFKSEEFFTDSLFITLDTHLEYINQKIDIKLATVEGEPQRFTGLSVGDILNYQRYSIRLVRITKGQHSIGQYGLEVSVIKK